MLFSDYEKYDYVWRHYELSDDNNVGVRGDERRYHYLPLGSAWRPVQHTANGGVSKPATGRQIKCSFIGNVKNSNRKTIPTLPPNNRTAMVDALTHECNVVHSLANSDLQTRDSLMGETTFCPCPGGNNFETFRFYEALEAGCVPVLVRGEPGLDEFLFAHMLVNDDFFILADNWEHSLELMNDIYYHDDAGLLLGVMQANGKRWWEDRVELLRIEWKGIIQA